MSVSEMAAPELVKEILGAEEIVEDGARPRVQHPAAGVGWRHNGDA